MVLWDVGRELFAKLNTVDNNTPVTSQREIITYYLVGAATSLLFLILMAVCAFMLFKEAFIERTVYWKILTPGNDKTEAQLLEDLDKVKKFFWIFDEVEDDDMLI